MKLLYRANSLEEANESKAILELAGIPVMISGENFSGLRLPFFPNNLGVFIYLDEQYNDAQKVIADPNYMAESAIDVEDFYQLLESAEFRHNVNTGYLAIFSWLIGTIIVAAVVLYFLYRNF